MWSIGAIELLLTALVAGAGFIAVSRGSALAKWLFPAASCCAVASILTPADIASTLIFFAALFSCFYFGTRQRQTVAASEA